MSFAAAAIAAGLTAARAHAGEDVTYCRGATELAFAAIKGRREPGLDEQPGYMQTEREKVDWIFPLSELAGLSPAEPAAADWIEWDDRKYPLTAAEDGKVWRWLNPAQTWLRVHTVRGEATGT